MPLTKEIYRDQYYQHIKEIFYNDKQQVIGIFVRHKSDGEEQGQIGVHEYTGESYRLIRYQKGTKAYAHFTSNGHTVFGKAGWYSIDEAFSVQDFKYEKGVLIAETYRNEDGHTYSFSYTYQNGVKVSETNVAVDGKVTKINFVYQGNKLLSKATLINGQFSEQINYQYHQNNLLAEEQKFLKHNEGLYLSFQKNFFYNAQEELERTEHQGRYDGKLHLYKVEETIRKGNERTIKELFVPEVEMVMGHYDLSSMHDFLKRENMEWGISIFNKQYITTAKLQPLSHKIEKVDVHGNVIEVKILNPENGEEMAKILYRNEYNDMSLLEFVISYRVTENGIPEENDIRKYYYKD